MARLFRTPNILLEEKRPTHYPDGVNYVDTSKMVDTVEIRLLKALTREIIDGKKPSQTRLMMDAGTTGDSAKRYEYIFRDTVDMINMFQLGFTEKPADLKNIPNFDTLEAETMTKTYNFLNGIIEEFGVLIFDLHDENKISESLFQKVSRVFDAVFSNSEQNKIHKDFAELTINEMFTLVSDKYRHVQELLKEYNELKSQ